MRLHLHDYRDADLAGIVDGAVLMHRQAAAMIMRRQHAHPHDLTEGPAAVAHVRDEDVVYAGSGPYAYLYHLWRERSGRSFRIVREVHTTFWSGYWAQEELCAPLTRPDDVVLFPSEFARQVFAHNGLGRGRTAVAYPMLRWLPRVGPVRPPPRDRTLRIGYLGACSAAKNFDQVLDVFARCHHDSGGRARLVYAGKPNHPRWRPENVLAGLDAPASAVSALGVVGHRDLASFFARIDVLLFPSTASRESLGRVIVESLQHGVPVVAADVGPAVELLPPDNLVRTELRTDRQFTMDRVEPLGRVDEDAFATTLLDRGYAAHGLHNPVPFEDTTFWHAMAGNPVEFDLPHDTRTPRRTVVVPRPHDTGDTVELAERVFLDYFQRRPRDLLALIADRERADGVDRSALRAIVRDPARNLADYRAFPRLLDGLVLAPLRYRFTEDACPATTRTEHTSHEQSGSA